MLVLIWLIGIFWDLQHFLQIFSSPMEYLKVNRTFLESVSCYRPTTGRMHCLARTNYNLWNSGKNECEQTKGSEKKKNFISQLSKQVIFSRITCEVQDNTPGIITGPFISLHNIWSDSVFIFIFRLFHTLRRIMTWKHVLHCPMPIFYGLGESMPKYQ